MAVADVYDALISRHYYKDGMAHEVAVDIITKGAGQHFDPDIAAAFLEILPKIKQIADSLADD